MRVCQTEKTHPKNRRRVEPLTKCTNLGSTLLDAARLQQKERVLIYLEGLGVDSVAAEVVYHRSCYQEFTNKYVLERLKDTSAEKESPYTEAFKALFAQVEQALLEDEQVMTLPAVRNQFVECLRKEWVENPAYRTEKVKHHLREHFDNRVVFYQPDKVGEPGIVCGANIPLHRLAGFLNNKGGTSSTESNSQSPQLADIAVTLEQPHHSTIIDLYHAALLIRSDIKSVKDSMPWPASPKDVDDAKANVPASLYNLLAWIVIGDFIAAVPTEGKFVEVASDEDHC